MVFLLLKIAHTEREREREREREFDLGVDG
jgi:hypothetical protein